MDATSGNNMDTGIHRDKLGLLFILFSSQVCAGNIPGAAQLSLRRLRSRKGLGLVLRSFPSLSSSMDRHVHRLFRRFLRLWSPVACPSKCHLLALCPGKEFVPSSSYFSFFFVTTPNLLRQMQTIYFIINEF